MLISAPSTSVPSELINLSASFKRALRAANRAETTVTIYTKAICYLVRGKYTLHTG